MKQSDERERVRRWAEEVLAARSARAPHNEGVDTMMASAIVRHRQHVISKGRRLGGFIKALTLASIVGVWYAWGSKWTVLGAVFVALGVYLSRSIRYWIAVRSVLGRDELPFDALRPGLLFLRSFNDDRWRYNIAPFGLVENLLFHLEEEMLFDITTVGPIVAIGGKQDTRSSIIRIALPESTWQKDVTALVTRSDAVLLFPHFTGGLQWEVEHMLRPGNREKLLVLIPAKGYLDIATRWSRLICQMILSRVPITPADDWDDATLRAQDELLPDVDPMVAKIRELHEQHGGDAASYIFLRHCLLIRAVGCAFDPEGRPVLFTSTVSGGFGGWWRPLPHSYRYVLKMMMDYKLKQ